MGKRVKGGGGVAKGKLGAEERMRLLCEKSLEFMAGRMGEAERPPYRFFATLGIPENDRVKGLLEVGQERGRWYVLAGAMRAGTDRLFSQYLISGTEDEVRAFFVGPESAKMLEETLWESVKRAEE